MIEKMKKIILLLLIFCSNLCVGINFYEYNLDLFAKEKVPTEYLSYQLLKKHPIKKKINYLVIPWSVLLNNNKLDKVPKIKLNHGFTICQHIHYEKIIPILINIGIDVLFAPHVTPQVRNKYPNIKILPYPLLAIHGVEPKPKTIYYSFIGCNTHSVRKKIFKLKYNHSNTYIRQRREWHFNIKNLINDKVRQLQEKLEYQEVLARSRFSLCPRGTGANTLRFWESLQAGAIPVLFADDMVLPEGFNWSSCAIKIPESDVWKLDKILSKISPQKEKEMRENCLLAYTLFSDQNLVSVIRDFYK